ncbi:MAG TPA: S9 family peptidase, partial [Pyrinomonadaceae bacterium]|nr:S9 family peptidase [Pyrinomonadaceae bacterium]
AASPPSIRAAPLMSASRYWASNFARGIAPKGFHRLTAGRSHRLTSGGKAEGRGRLRVLLATAVVCLLSSGSFAQPRRAMAPADILRIANVSDAQISPNGEWIVYAVSTTEGDSTRSTLWLARVLADPDRSQPTTRPAPTTRETDQYRDWPEVRRQPIQLLPAAWNASTPRWAPDGSQIAFLATQDGQTGIWLTDIDRSSPKLVAPVQSTNFFITYAGESFDWSPDSRRIAYISASEEADASAKPNDPRVIDRIQYKSRTSFSDKRRTHVWVVDLDRPEPRQLTSGPFYDHAVAYSANGEEIAFLSNHEADPDANNNSDIFAVDLHGEVRQITNTRGCEFDPNWSPDGKLLAYLATKRDVTTIDSVAEDTHVWVIDAAGGRGRELATKLDRRARSPRWAGNGRHIYFLAGDEGETKLWSVKTDGDDLREIFPHPDASGTPSEQHWRGQPFQLSGFSLNSRSLTQIAFVMSDAVHPAEVWSAAATLPPVRQRISRHNDEFRRSVRLSEPTEVKFKSFDGTSIQGWLMKPLGWRSDRKYPLILSIHGGPHGMSGWGFNAAFQVYAARGYGVLFLNPRGSSGYGQKFSDGTLGDWGGGDYKDLMAGVDEALRRQSWIHPERLGVTGGSYGGFMTNWIITQTPRFKAAVASASLSNLISFYSTSLYQDLIHAEFSGFPWDNFELLWQWSPLRYVKQAQTPTLFLHGEQDNDVHITQAEEMYMALKRRGVETVLVRYPREGHGLREPQHRVDALERALAWFDRFLK